MKKIHLVIALERKTGRVGSIKAFKKLSDAQLCTETYNSFNKQYIYIIETHQIQ